MVNAIRFMFVCNAMLIACCIGCDQKEMAETMNKAGESVEKSATDIGNEASEMAKKGGEMAQKLGADAMAFLNPLKEKLGDLDNLKETPEKLKTAVTDLINSIEQKAEKVQLPEAMTQTIAKLKEKLISLKEYLEGEYDQAEIGKRLKGIMDEVKSEFGMSK